MNKKKTKNILKVTSLHDELKKKEENNTSQERIKRREESLMKKRKEKLVSNSQCLNNIGGYSEFLPSLYELKEGLASAEMDKKKKAITELRKILSTEKNPPIEQIVHFDILPLIVESLKSELPELQFEAAWILTNIASGTSVQTSSVVRCGTVPIFISLIKNSNENLREQSIWALGNIAGDSCEHRDLVLQGDVLDPLMKEISLTGKISFLRTATWVLSNLCRGKPPPNEKYLNIILEGLVKIIFSEDIEILGDACWALSYISEKNSQSIIKCGIIQRTIELLVHENIHVQTPALRIIGNIVAGDDTQTQLVINCAVLPCLVILLNSPRKTIKKEVCWVISNIAAGNFEQIQALVECGIFPVLIHILVNMEMDVKKEAAWAISNAISGGKFTHINYLVKQGCIKPMLDMIDFVDTRLIRVILESIENILKAGKPKTKELSGNKYAKIIEQVGGIEKLEMLQYHKNSNVYKKSLEILEKYFEIEEKSNENKHYGSNENFLENNKQIPICSFDFYQ